MAGTKKWIFTFAALTAAAVLILLGVLLLITKSFVIDVMLHIFLRILLVLLAIQILKKCFREQLADRMNKVLAVCGCVIAVDLVVVDAIRYIFSHGASTVLFLPCCSPVCFMIVMASSVAHPGVEKGTIKRAIFLVGIPLLLLSLYFEVVSFL